MTLFLRDIFVNRDHVGVQVVSNLLFHLVSTHVECKGNLSLLIFDIVDIKVGQD